MDGELDREFKECGGCPEDTIGEQWKQIKFQLSSGHIPKEQGKIMEGHEVTWAWLQEKGQIPGDEKQAKLLPYLADAKRAVLRGLERHKAEEGKQSWKTKRKWRAELEKKERRRASVHTIALACVALEAQEDKNKPRTVTKTVTASPTGPTTPDLYPDLKSLCAHAASDNTDKIKTPPQYTVSTPQGIQAPVINVRGGMLDLETDLQGTEAATRQEWESLVQNQRMTILAATKELKENQEELEVLRQETRRERAGRPTGQTTGYELGQDPEERIARARWGGTTPNARGRIGGRGRRATRTQAGAGAPVAITTRGSNGTKSQLSDGHYVHQEEEKQKDLESDQATNKAQLLKLQLGRERRMLNEAKKPLKQSSQMLQQPRAQQGQLQQQPMVPPAPAYPPVQDMCAQPPRQTGRGGFRGRGRGNRPRDPRDQCYVCGQMGHWARGCRTPAQNNYPQQYGPQQQGYGPQQRDVRYQAPNPAAAPRGQYHLSAHNDNPVPEGGEDSHYHQES